MDTTAKISAKAKPVAKGPTNQSFVNGRIGTTSFFQPKLSINQPGDAHEVQADAVAEQVMNGIIQTTISPVAVSSLYPSSIQKDEEGPREEEQDPLTGGLGVVADNLEDNSPAFEPFLDRLKYRLWDSQPTELRSSIIGFGVADALILGTVFALSPRFRNMAINTLPGFNLMKPLHLIPNSEYFTPSSITYQLPEPGHPSYEFNGEFDLTPYFEYLHDHNGSFPVISPRFGLNLDYNPETQSLRVVGGTFNLDLFNRAIMLEGGVNQFYTPGPTFFAPTDPFALPVTSMLTLPSQQIRDTRFSITVDVPRLINVIRGVPEPEVQRKENKVAPGPTLQRQQDKREEEEEVVQRMQERKEEEEEIIQRKEEQREEDEEMLQRSETSDEPIQSEPQAQNDPVPEISRKATSGETAATSSNMVEAALAGAGNNMDEETRQFMEERFGHDFSQVKIHDDSTAHQSSKAINALAYTHQNHIVFGAGQYDPHSVEGKRLLAHELTHVVQQGAGGVPPSVQRRLVRGPEMTAGIQPILTEATTTTAIIADGLNYIRDNPRVAATNILVFTQNGLSVYSISSGRIVQTYARREDSPMMVSGLYFIEADSTTHFLVYAPEGVNAENYTLTFNEEGFTPERLEIIRARRTRRVTRMEDYLMVEEAELMRLGYFPALLMVTVLPATGTGGGARVAEWAETQTRQITQRMGLGRSPGDTRSGGDSSNAPETPPSQRDTTADARRPDRIVVWPREDGKQFLNVWVGGRNREDGGIPESVELHEGESLEDLQARVERATERGRERLTERAIEEENRVTGGGVPYNQWTFTGGQGGEGPRPNRSSYRATMSGPEVMVRNGTGAYNMSLHYEDEYPDLLGQVSAAFNGSDYVWQVLDITALYQRVLRERGEAVQARRQAVFSRQTPGEEGAVEEAPSPVPAQTPQPVGPGEAEQQLTETGSSAPVSGMETVGRFDADLRDLQRRDRNFTEDVNQAWYDMTNPVASQDGSAGAAVRSVLVNSFNLATIPLHAVTSLGGWVVRVFSSIFNSDPAYQEEIPFPNRDGYYLVRCIAQPRPIGDGEDAIVRMPSVAVKVVEVKEIQQRTTQELTSHGQNLEANILELLLAYRVAGNDEQRNSIRQVLEIKVQEAAQTHRSFLQAEIDNREQNLERRQQDRETNGVEDGDPVEVRIREEIEILRQGTSEGSGLISAIIARQIALKERELAAMPEWDIYRRRDLSRQIAQLRSRLETAEAREAEMRGGGQPIVRPEAVFVNEEDGQTIPVLIEIGQVGSQSPISGYTMRLSDITGTSSDQHDSIGRTRAQAVRHSIAEYAGHFPYGRGYLTVRFPEGNSQLNFGITEPITVRCNPRDTAQASERLDELLQVLAVVGLFIPGVGVAVAAVGAAVSAGRILSRLNNHTFAWDTNTVMDVLNIVGAVAGGVRQIAGGRLVTAQRMWAIVPESEDFAAWVTRLSRFNSVITFVDNTVNEVSYLLGMMETVNQYLEIQQQEISGAITHAEARRRRAGLMAQAMYDQFMQHGQDMVDAYRGDGTRITPEERERARVEHEGPLPHEETPPRDTETLPEETRPRTGEEESRRGGGGEPHPSPRQEYTGTPAEKAAQFMNDPANRHQLLWGDRHAVIQQLLRLHGNWRDLVMMIQGEPHNENFQFYLDNLQSMRADVVAELARRFGLQLSDPNASTHASSDVDLATTGPDAGARMTAAERYMRERYGPNWSEQLRMNFYTEAERLFMYEQVRPQMSEQAFGQLQGRLSQLAEILNFAKMLQHAEGNPDSVSRVEQLMAHLDADQQAQVRERAGRSSSEAAQRTGELHATIDNLAARFEALRASEGSAVPAAARGPLPETLPAHLREAIARAVTPDELRVALAAAISELQMEANFHTTEAYISPGAGRQVVRGVAVSGHEAYQSALAHLEMMEHVIYEAGGNVERAAREYELYKYIQRFITAMQLAGIPANSFMLMYYQAAYDIYRSSRTSLQGVGSHDMGYLLAMHQQFVSEAASVLPQMREAALANPSLWNSVPRSLEATATGIRDTGAPGSTTPPPTPAAAGGGSGRLGTVGSLLGTGRGMVAIADVPIIRNTTLDGNETRATFVHGRLVLELGPMAGHEQLRQHVDTLRVLQRYEGTLGLVRRLFSQIGELLGMGPGYGSRGFEAQREVTKLLEIRADLETRKQAIEEAMTRVSEETLAVLEENYERLLTEISSIESQVQRHESEVGSTAAARGHVAMGSTTPAGPVMTEASHPGEFRHEPAVGQTRRYRDKGGTEGVVSRLTHTTLAIITRLGQTTIRADYQRWTTPSQFGLPSGRHGFEALHAIGPIVGHESPYGIYFGPWRVNQLIQRVCMEKYIANIGSHIRPGREVLLRVEVERVTLPVTQADGSVRQVDFLKSITYQLYGETVIPGNKLFEMSLEVATPDDPVSEVHFDEDSIFMSRELNDYTDMARVAEAFEPEFSSTDPIDE